MARKSSEKQDSGYLQSLETDLKSNQSKLSLVLGALIVLVIGILIFNYFSKSKPDLGPAQQTETDKENMDVSPDKLPGKYTVKEGDTLFSISEKYYQDGYKYENIAKANNIQNPNSIEVGQVLNIPKLEESASNVPMTEPPQPANQVPAGEKGTTPASLEFGPLITSNTYTVLEGDWLSKIAGRAYGDIMAYQKIAKANNIQNPDLIEPGMVLTIPR